MQYRISRTTRPCDDDGNDLAPCPEAFRSKCIRVDRRTFDEAEFDRAANGWCDTGPWRSAGRNHRIIDPVTNNGAVIARDFDDEDWFVEVDDLLAFIKKYGRCVVGPHYTNPDEWHIEIYDGYRE